MPTTQPPLDVESPAKKPGEEVHITFIGLDAQGMKISKLTYETYGYTNYLANLTQVALVKSMADTIAGLSEVKNAKGKG